MDDCTSQPSSKRPCLTLAATTVTSTTRVALALCGSFNPITYLHLRLFELARDYLHQTGKYVVERGILSCVHDAYGKKGLLSSCHRLAMCQLAVKTSDWIQVDTWECEQDKWTTTYEVLQKLQERLPKDSEGSQAKIMLLCGADLLESFATPSLWDNEDLRGILGVFGGIVAVSRFGHNPEKFAYESDQLFRYKNNIHICTDWIPNDVSSTKIRRCLRRGESVKYLVPDNVLDYIKEHDLYQE